MNADNQDFEALRRLLKLKRHEKPPPRYFNDFSSQVLDRIKANAPADRENVMERMVWESPWLQRILGAFQDKPIVAGAFGAAVCALLLGGLLYADYGVKPDAPGLATAQSLPAVGAQPAGIFQNDTALALSSTNPVALGAGSIFDGVKINAQPINFRPGGN